MLIIIGADPIGEEESAYIGRFVTPLQVKINIVKLDAQIVMNTQCVWR